MTKVAIITIMDMRNYGNRLQNYALQEAVKKLGYEVLTIDNIYVRTDSHNVKIRRPVNYYVDKVKNVVKDKFCSKSLGYVKKLRQKHFREFTATYINISRDIIYSEHISEKIIDSFSCFVVGSDQVWNPYYRDDDDVMFLTFTDKKKRVAYAPSFGIDTLPHEVTDKYAKLLNGFDSLSVRENSGQRLVKELTGKDIPIVLDPTLLLTSEEWDKISTKPKVETGYLLVYFLGSLTLGYCNRIKHMARKHNLSIVWLNTKKDITYFSVNPSEFIGLIKYCSLMMTDSFHGAIFSIIYKRPFVVFKRRSGMSLFSRLEYILNRYGLSECIYKKNNNEFSVDYSEVDEKIIADRERSLTFLAEAIKERDNTNE